MACNYGTPWTFLLTFWRVVVCWNVQAGNIVKSKSSKMASVDVRRVGSGMTHRHKAKWINGTRH